MKTFLRVCTLCCAGIAAATTTAATVCAQGDLSRTVSVVHSVPGQPVPCEVLYEKNDRGQAMTLWRAQNEAGYCEARAADFVAKLTDLGWTCTTANSVKSSQPASSEASKG